MIYLILASSIFFMDYFIKEYVVEVFTFQTRKEILKGKVILQKLYNKGGIMSFMQEKPELLKGISGFLLVLFSIAYLPILFKKRNYLLKTGCALLLGGAASNVYDRLQRGYVVDYFSLKIEPIKKIVFNISDFCIFFGSILFMLFRNKK